MSHAYFEGFPLPESNPPAASWLRRTAAVILLCAVGMLVVSSLFASPAQRTAYRQPTGSIAQPARTASSPARSTLPARHSANDHC